MKTYQRYFIYALRVSAFTAILCIAFLVLTFNWNEPDPFGFFPAPK